MANEILSPAGRDFTGAFAPPVVPPSATPDATPPQVEQGLSGGDVNGPAQQTVAGPAAPHQNLALHILDALGGANPSDPMAWAKSTLAGSLAAGANVGKTPPGGGFLYGLTRGAQGVQEQRHQQMLDVQNAQRQQQEMQLKQNADVRAQKELDIRTADATAQRAMWNAQTAASIATEQRNAARFGDLQQEDRLHVQQLHDQIRESEADQLSVLAAAGVNISDLAHVTSYDQITGNHIQQVGAGSVFAVPNGEAHKAGEDGAGAYIVPGDVWDRSITKPVSIITGWEVGKDGKATPIKTTATAGTPVGTLMAIAKGAQKDLQTKQQQVFDQAKLAEERANTSRANAEAFKATEEGKVEGALLGGGPAGGAGTPANINPQTGADDAYLSTLPPNLAAEVKSIGEGRVEVNSRMFQSKQGQQLAAALTRAYPGFDQSKAQSYFKVRQDFTSGKTSQAINSYNTGIAHLGTMWDHLANASSVEINNPFSTLHRQLDLDKQLVSTELAKAVSNGSMTEGEKNQILSSISGRTVNSYRTRLREAVELLHGKQEAFQQQWNNGAPPGAVSQVPIISQQAEQTISKINGQQQQQPQQQGHPHPVGEVKEYMGAKYIFDGKQYVLQQEGKP